MIEEVQRNHHGDIRVDASSERLVHRASAPPRAEIAEVEFGLVREAMERQNIASGTSWESSVGYSRAVRVGNTIHVSGTVAVDANGNVVGKGDPYEQARFALQKIEQALVQAGSSLSDVVRTRMYVTDISHWEAIGQAHGEFFREIRPASTMVEVSGLIGAEMLVEIEVEAFITQAPEGSVATPNM